ncbi:MAG: hypothetical protein SLAVMIC_01014 [uncultured marine phage]|uniref:Uncharacterized protein n=1 Tax=uncultured marine phage TaxID=707152 RepID=A0A8D9CF68_9VIRU|nr:MAG: hypothetical protein SLAVMIC_01014 [uncultured marine phage]
MIIYDLDKIHDDETRKILTSQVPLSIKTDSVAHLIDGMGDTMDSEEYQRFDNLVYINTIHIENILIKDNKIIGDISFGDVKIRYRRLKAIDLKEQSNYTIFFKPAFGSKLISGKVVPENFSNFYVYIVEKSKFREERLAKLLEI